MNQHDGKIIASQTGPSSVETIREPRDRPSVHIPWASTRIHEYQSICQARTDDAEESRKQFYPRFATKKKKKTHVPASMHRVYQKFRIS